MAAECLSGNCVDTVCCATACGGKCQSCNLSGAIGSCSNIPAATDPDSECNQGQDGSATCNGLAACGDTGPTGAACVPNAMNVCTNGGGACPANGICP